MFYILWVDKTSEIQPCKLKQTLTHYIFQIRNIMQNSELPFYFPLSFN